MFLSPSLILFLLLFPHCPPPSLLLPKSPYNPAPAGEWPTLHIKVSRLTPILIPQNVLRGVCVCVPDIQHTPSTHSLNTGAMTQSRLWVRTPTYVHNHLFRCP